MGKAGQRPAPGTQRDFLWTYQSWTVEELPCGPHEGPGAAVTKEHSLGGSVNAVCVKPPSLGAAVMCRHSHPCSGPSSWHWEGDQAKVRARAGLLWGPVLGKPFLRQG